MCALSFVCALILPDTVVAVTLVYFLDRVFSTIYKEDMDRPLRSSAHASSLQASQSLLLHQDSVTQPSLEQLENEALFDRLSEAVGSLKTGDSKQHTLQGAFKTTSDDDSGASGTTTSTALREGAREVRASTSTGALGNFKNGHMFLSLDAFSLISLC
ncbi:hypothetical protein HPB48_009810 [Haemaphysalis longicornis]|uniref:Uncharacterized protein n=1 Tax=Haemaphysalis longicornis TaxID=44386 RepID=A0A9J6GTF5_HAELO|nr:hypothetical protein HPB48_009810 [Haemaphysalis longicornis]